PPFRARIDTMGLWAKSVVIFNAIRKYGTQSVRYLAERTGLSKSRVHRHLQAVNRRNRYPETSLWETAAGRPWCHLTHKSATLAKICVKKANLAKLCVKLSLKKRQKGGGIHGKMPTIAC
ncbi:MAG TPA: winged helix-turn-helix domain-containing protein, partial [Candidatus Saccharimonadales bacterium]|nr:winged helix-turn-helix domain-containing protein [Candidatus Saccharimonadales bacterium]